MRSLLLRAILIIVSASCCAPSGSSRAATLHVPSEYHAIQPALDAAADGDTVLVAPGIYEGPFNRNLDFRGKTLALIGRAGASATLLDCDGRGRGFHFHSGEGPGCLLRGFTVRGGAALGVGAAGKGGGIYCGSASPRVEACIFRACEAQFGGGLGAEWDARPLLAGCAFLDNRARLDGGGLHYLDGGGELRDCRLRGNRAGTLGPDAYLGDSSMQLVRCRFDVPPARPVLAAPTL